MDDVACECLVLGPDPELFAENSLDVIQVGNAVTSQPDDLDELFDALRHRSQLSKRERLRSLERVRHLGGTIRHHA